MVKNLIGQDIVDLVLIIDQNWNQQDLFCERKKKREHTMHMQGCQSDVKDVKDVFSVQRMSKSTYRGYEQERAKVVRWVLTWQECTRRRFRNSIF